MSRPGRPPRAGLGAGIALLWAGSVLAAAPARADRGDLAAGVRVGYLPRQRLAVGVEAIAGVNDWAQAFAALAVEAERPAAGRALRGMVGASVLWDALAWVPAATFVVGTQRDGDGWGPVAAARGELRRFLARHLFASVAAGGLWARGQVGPEFSLSIAWQN